MKRILLTIFIAGVLIAALRSYDPSAPATNDGPGSPTNPTHTYCEQMYVTRDTTIAENDEATFVRNCMDAVKTLPTEP